MSSQSENLVTSCPQCNSLVGLPSVMSLDAAVRCPVCGHKYALRSRLPQTIPQLELVVNSDEENVGLGSAVNPIDPTAKLQVNEILRKNAKLSRRRQRHGSRSGEGRRQVKGSSASASPPVAGKESTSYREFQAIALGTSLDDEPKVNEPAARPNSESAALKTAGDLADYERKMAARSRRSRRSSRQVRQWVEIAKIAFGAFLALPVAQLIIWWGLAVDPLKLAPTVAKAIPFLVPAKVLEAAEEE